MIEKHKECIRLLEIIQRLEQEEQKIREQISKGYEMYEMSLEVILESKQEIEESYKQVLKELK